MLSIGQGFLRHFINIFSASVLTGGALSTFTLSGWFVIPVFAGIYGITNLTVRSIQKFRKRRHSGLTRVEFKHVDEQLKIANQKIAVLNKYYLQVRSMNSFKQLHEIARVSKNIVKLVRAEPAKFFAAESFFYAHLDSAVTLTEKYSLLSRQPVKDSELTIALADTRETLNDLTDLLKLDLKQTIASDIETLHLEIDFAKHSQQKRKKELEWRGDDQ